jgi:TRAP-type C4-dicarboxylate transport system substrate-binding protein
MMSAEQQEGVKKAAYEAAVWQRQAMQDFQLESRKNCEAAGCEIIDVDVPSFQTAVASVYDLYPQYKDIVAAINAVK